jgi:hypothetical protein
MIGRVVINWIVCFLLKPLLGREQTGPQVVHLDLFFSKFGLHLLLKPGLVEGREAGLRVGAFGKSLLLFAVYFGLDLVDYTQVGVWAWLDRLGVVQITTSKEPFSFLAPLLKLVFQFTPETLNFKVLIIYDYLQLLDVSDTVTSLPQLF